MEPCAQIWAELSRCAADPTFDSCVSTVSTATVTLILHTTLGLLCYIAAVVTNNDSYVDRLWSFAPVLSAWVHALGASWWSPRHTFAALVTLWGARLSYNFWRKGGYTLSYEDHRWAYVRQWPGLRARAGWELFRFAFISMYQMWLLWAIVLPVAAMPTTYDDTNAHIIDAVCAVAFLLAWVAETRADQQQWDFQNYKGGHARTPADLEGDVRRGFITHGLWRLCRHPNVAAEQSMWVIVYVATAWHLGVVVHPLGIGAALLVQLTVVSCLLTETISSRKYAPYKIYKDHVCMLLPAPRLSQWALEAALSKHS